METSQDRTHHHHQKYDLEGIHDYYKMHSLQQQLNTNKNPSYVESFLPVGHRVPIPTELQPLNDLLSSFYSETNYHLVRMMIQSCLVEDSDFRSTMTCSYGYGLERNCVQTILYLFLE